jgi:hypothetical protein
VAMWGGGEIVAAALSFKRAVSAMMEGDAKAALASSRIGRASTCFPTTVKPCRRDALYLFCEFLCAQTVSHIVLDSRWRVAHCSVSACSISEHKSAMPTWTFHSR